MKRLTAVLVIIMLVFITACNRAEPEPEPKPALKPELSFDDTIRKTIKIDHGKPGAPIRLNSQVPKSALSGTVISVQLELISATQTGNLQVKLNTNSAISLSGAAEFSFTLDGQANSLSVELYLAEEGLHYLNVITQELNENGDALLGRSFAVPIQVGQVNQKMRINGKMVDDGEEKIIEMIAD